MLQVQIDGLGDLVGEDIIKATVWTDLVPIPVYAEVILKAGTISNDIGENVSFRIGEYSFLGVLVESDDSGELYDSGKQTEIKITGFLESCAKISYRAERPIIRSDTTMGTVYSIAGCTIPIGTDIPISRFYCYLGDTPTAHVLPALQQEAALPRYKDGAIHFVRLDDLARQEAVTQTAQNPISVSESEFLKRHIIPFYFTLKDDGGFLEAGVFDGRDISFIPVGDERVVANMTKILVFKKSIDCMYSPTVNAGDVYRYDGTDYIVMTAAHQGGSSVQEITSLWLGVVE